MITKLNISNSFVFVFVGRIVKDKGIEELINSFSLLQNNTSKSVKLLLVGNFEINSKPICNKVLNEIKSNSNIIFLGFQEDVRQYLSISNCLVLPSYREGFPNVCLQASSMGIPIIMTNVSGSDEMINDFTGYLVNKYDSVQLYLAMLKMLNNYNKFNSEIIRNNIINNFSQDLILTKLLEFYKKTLNLN
jgi:glycosyltransferase involved in cell wall biosynthesis